MSPDNGDDSVPPAPVPESMQSSAARLPGGSSSETGADTKSPLMTAMPVAEPEGFDEPHPPPQSPNTNTAHAAMVPPILFMLIPVMVSCSLVGWVAGLRN